MAFEPDGGDYRRPTDNTAGTDPGRNLHEDAYSGGTRVDYKAGNTADEHLPGLQLTGQDERDFERRTGEPYSQSPSDDSSNNSSSSDPPEAQEQGSIQRALEEALKNNPDLFNQLRRPEADSQPEADGQPKDATTGNPEPPPQGGGGGRNHAI